MDRMKRYRASENRPAKVSAPQLPLNNPAFMQLCNRCWPTTQAKLLYHAFHKLFELKRILGTYNPLVRLPEEEREFVMDMR